MPRRTTALGSEAASPKPRSTDAKFAAAVRGGPHAIRKALTLEATHDQHLEGAADPELVDPDAWTLDQPWLDRPGRAELYLVGTGHFALDEQTGTIAGLVGDFIARNSR